MSTDRVVNYADNAGVAVAYQVVGDGPIDIVITFDWASNIDLVRTSPHFEPVIRRLADIARVILFDMRGCGLSDPVDELPSLETWADDVRAVMTETGSTRAALVGFGQAAQLALMFAATYPQQTTGVVAVNGFACLRQAQDYPFGFSPAAERRAVEIVAERWGTGSVLGFSSPALAASVGGVDGLARSERAAGSPRRAALKQALSFDIDIRDALSSIAVPTLIVQSKQNRYVGVEHARYLVDHISGAQYLELPGAEHVVTAGSDDFPLLIETMEEFLTGSKRPPVLDRALRTVVFTDIVGSTELASAMGDHRWRFLLEQHELVSRREIEAARGHMIKSTGDGVMATFDGPARAVHCVRSIAKELEPLGLPIRAGLHTGEVELMGDDIGGIAVHIAARISGLAAAGEILVTSTVRDLVAGSGLAFDDRGEHELKGLTGAWRALAVR